MYERMLILLDGSTASEATIPHAIGLATCCGASVHLLRVVETSAHIFPEVLDTVGFQGAPDGVAAKEHEEHENARLYLENVAREFKARGIPTTIEVAGGSEVEAIVRVATERGAGLILMSTASHRALNGLFSGSETERVLARSGRPLLLIHPS